MPRFIKTLALCASLSFSGAVFAADWPQYLGPKADGFSPEKLANKDWAAKTPAVLWQVPMHDDGYACPSAADGKVFIIDHQDKQDIVLALDQSSGKEVWTFKYDEPAANNYGYARATPVFENGKLYTLSQGGRLHCFDANTGKVLWQRNIVSDFGGQKPEWDYSGAPVIDGDKLIITISADTLLGAVNKNTGELIWKGGKDEKLGYDVPVIATINGQKQYVYLAGKSVVGVSAEDGQQLWSYPWETQYDVNASTPLVLGNSVFVSSQYKRGCALIDVSVAQPKLLWENKEMQCHFNTPLVYQGYIYGISEEGGLVCLDPKTGKAAWKQGGFAKGGVMGIDGTLIAVNGTNGTVGLFNLDPTACKELGRFKPLGGESWTPPIVSNGNLILRNKKAVACIDLK